MTRTLADMTPDERDQCVGMWFELGVPDYLVVLVMTDDPYDGHAAVMVPHRPKNKMTYTLMHTLTPRFDLPRAWTPSGEPVSGEWVESPNSEHHHRWCSRWEKKPDEAVS